MNWVNETPKRCSTQNILIRIQTKMRLKGKIDNYGNCIFLLMDRIPSLFYLWLIDAIWTLRPPRRCVRCILFCLNISSFVQVSELTLAFGQIPSWHLSFEHWFCVSETFFAFLNLIVHYYFICFFFNLELKGFLNYI